MAFDFDKSGSIFQRLYRYSQSGFRTCPIWKAVNREVGRKMTGGGGEEKTFETDLRTRAFVVVVVSDSRRWRAGSEA